MIIRRCRPDETEAVADMVRALAKDSGSSIVPKVTGEQIREQTFSAKPLIWCFVAEHEAELVGTILLEPIFSTWRGQKGLYVVDLYVSAQQRRKGLGEKLIRTAASEGRVAGFEYLRLEVEQNNQRAADLYKRLGFKEDTARVMFLTRPEFEQLITEKPTR
jgi:ribosomal protein S18 acetylase RimI-like enzyme